MDAALAPVLNVVDAIGPIVNVVSQLHPALSILQGIYGEYNKVRTRKKQCESVARRAGAILDTVNRQLASARDRSSPEALRNIKRMEEQFERIRDKLADLARWTTFKCLHRGSDFDEAIQESHRQLEDVCQCFMILAIVQVQYTQREAEQARQEDARQLEHLISDAAHRHAALLGVLQIEQRQHKEAMCALQKAIRARPDSDAMESRVMTKTLAALQQTSGVSIPKDLPPWQITAFELDVDEGSDLGAGGFGVVRKATWVGATVAVKLLGVGTPAKKVLQEITVWAQLRHPHVLPFLGASDSANPPFIVSWYMKNGNAVQYLEANPRSDRVRLVHQVAAGMAYLHQQKVIHGDLKGANIMIDDSGNACIGDFGLARMRLEYQSRTTTKLGELAGTLRFMAPEQMQGKLEFASDVYSYAMLIYQLFTEDIPFMMIPEQAIYYNAVAGEQRHLEFPEGGDAESRGLTSNMWSLIMRCSAFSPAARPPFSEIYPITRGLAEEWKADSRSEDTVITDCDSTSIDMDTLHLSDGPVRHVSALRPSGGLTSKMWSRVTQGVAQAWRANARSKDTIRTDRDLMSKRVERGRTVRFIELGSEDATRSPESTAQTELPIGDKTIVFRPAPSQPAPSQTSALHYRLRASPLVMREHTDCVTSVVFSNDGTRVISASRDGTVCVWNASLGSCDYGMDHGTQMNSVAISPDGTRIASGGYYTRIRLWDTNSGRQICESHTDSDAWARLAFSQDGSRFMMSDMSAISIWNMRTITSRRSVEPVVSITPPRVMSARAVFTPDGHILSGSWDGWMDLWDVAHPSAPHLLASVQASLNRCLRSVAASADGSFIVSGGEDTCVRIWDAQRLTAIGSALKGHTGWVMSVAISEDGRAIVSGDFDGMFRVWDVRTGNVAYHSEKIEERLCSVDMSRDGRRVVTGGTGMDVQIWDLAML